MAAAGKYKHLVKILQPVTEINEFGEQKRQYLLERQTRAAVLWRSGARKSENKEIFFPNQYDLILHRYVNITDETHIIFQDKEYRVVQYYDDMEHRDKVVKIEEINK